MLPLTQDVPKPLLEVNGKPLIVHTIERLKVAGIQDIVINIAYLGHKIRKVLGNGVALGVNIVYSEEPEPLETAGAILHASALLGDQPFLLINADVWSDYPLEHLINKPLSNLDAHLVLVDNPDHHPQGDFAVVSGMISSMDSPRFTYSGIALVSPRLVTHYPKARPIMPLIEPLRHAIASHRLAGEYYAGEWFDIGTPERLRFLNNRVIDSV